jgi:hypothetical protein
MRLGRTFLAIAIATLWVAVGSHCRLELLPGLGFLSCCLHPQSEPSPSQHEDDCAGDGCSAIESGFYKLENSEVAPIEPLLPLLAALTVAPEPGAPNAPAVEVLIASSPPKTDPRPWQFSQRAASPPRAPSIAS